MTATRDPAPTYQQARRTPRQQLLVDMARAASVGNLDPYADELLKLRALVQQQHAALQQTVNQLATLQCERSSGQWTNERTNQVSAALYQAREALKGDGPELSALDTARTIAREFRDHEKARDYQAPVETTIPGTGRRVDNQVGVRVFLLRRLAEELGM